MIDEDTLDMMKKVKFCRRLIETALSSEDDVRVKITSLAACIAFLISEKIENPEEVNDKIHSFIKIITKENQEKEREPEFWQPI